MLYEVITRIQERERQLSRAMDTIRLRCGGEKILRGSQMVAAAKV